MKLRIHHFFDIIRDFGSGKEIVPHSYGHAYHVVAEQIRNNPNLEIELIVASDEICKGCIHLVSGVCDDEITHRDDFNGKEDFNNHLDERIMQVCKLDFPKKYTPKELCQLASAYIGNIDFVYEGNAGWHTKQRKQNVLLGLKYYSKKYGFSVE